MALLNERAPVAFDKAWVGDPEAFQFPGHRPFFVQFNWKSLFQPTKRIHSPDTIPRKPPPTNTAEREELRNVFAPKYNINIKQIRDMEDMAAYLSRTVRYDALSQGITAGVRV